MKNVNMKHHLQEYIADKINWSGLDIWHNLREVETLKIISVSFCHQSINT